MDEHGTALVSGASPTLVSWMMSMDITPYAVMDAVLGAERYRHISA